MTSKETEYVEVPEAEQLDVDEGAGANALEGGPDNEDLDDFRDRSAAVWEGE